MITECVAREESKDLTNFSDQRHAEEVCGMRFGEHT